jgi:hypothetical protein
MAVFSQKRHTAAISVARGAVFSAVRVAVFICHCERSEAMTDDFFLSQRLLAQLPQ